MFGLEPEHWAIVERLLIHPLKSSGAEVWVFGSRVRGTHQKFSDLDVLYEHSTLRGGQLAEIEEALVESSLPIKVDLVDVRDLAVSYRASILSERMRV